MRCLFHIGIWDFVDYGGHISTVKKGDRLHFSYISGDEVTVSVGREVIQYYDYHWVPTIEYLWGTE